MSDDGGVEKCASDLLKTVHSSILSLQLLPAAHPEFEMKNTSLLLVSLLAFLSLSAKRKRLHWCRSPGISIFPSSFSLDSPYLVGEMHCTVKKALHCRKQSRLAGYSPGLAVFAVDGDKKQLVSPAVYRTSFKAIIPLSLHFPWYRGKGKKPIPNHLSLFLTLNCPQTLFYLKICPLYITIHTQPASALRHRALKIGLDINPSVKRHPGHKITPKSRIPYLSSELFRVFFLFSSP